MFELDARLELESTKVRYQSLREVQASRWLQANAAPSLVQHAEIAQICELRRQIDKPDGLSLL